MIQLTDAIERLANVIKTDYRHKDYTRVTELAAKYTMFYTGNDIDKELLRIYGVEIPMKLIFSIIPPILKSTEFPFNKVCRTKPVVKKIDFERSYSDEKVSEIEKVLGEFYKKQPIETFFENVVVKKNYTDPNAWIVTEFKEFDNTIEKAQPYPAIFSSSEAIDFQYNGNELQYLIVMQKDNDRKTWTMYIGYNTVQIAEIKEGEVSELDKITIENKTYTIQVFEPKLSFVPAVRCGYIVDVETENRTFVSVFDKVLQLIYKTLKIDFETDATLADIAFPKRRMFVDKCKNQGCSNGYLLNGELCPVCKGSGLDISHKTSLDIQTFPMPHDKSEMFPLSATYDTERPPVDAIKMQMEIRGLNKDTIFGIMFNSDAYDKTFASSTATAVNETRDNWNDAIYPFAKHLSNLYSVLAKSVAEIRDYSDAVIYHLYPNDFKFKTLSMLMRELSTAKTAGASANTLAAIEADIQEIQFADRPNDLRRIRIRNEFNPFFGLSEESVRAIIATKQTTEYNAVLWSNLMPIFAELEMQYDGSEKRDWIYDLNKKKIKTLVDEKVNQYIAALPKAPEPAMINFNENGD